MNTNTKDFTIKICGITDFKDAEAALELGVCILGFNFFSKSPRYISPREAGKIIRALPTNVWTCGVFVNPTKEDVENAIERGAINSLQFHGDESLSFCLNWPGFRVIKAFRVKEDFSLSEIKMVSDKVDYLLFDGFTEGTFGGTGKSIDSSIAERLMQEGLFSKAFLAGGLTPENVGERIKLCRPWGVDVASGIEQSPGKKDLQRMRKFVENAKLAFAELEHV